MPSSLIASWLATGPPGSVWAPPVSVVRSREPERFCTTPALTSTTAASSDSGSRIRTTTRTRSTQKLPSRSVRERTNPRMSATATHRPTAAETKFCTARPAICTVWPSVDSPEYHCQFVLVTNEIAVLNAPSDGTAGNPSDSGSHCCTRSSR